MKVRTVVRRTHQWVGLALSLILFILAVTGSALVYKDVYWRMVYPELRGATPELGPADHAEAIARALDRYGERLRSVKMPEPGVAAYHVYLDGGEGLLALDGDRVIDEWKPRERVMGFLFDVHAHLMAGEAGERIGGVTALLGAALIVTGLVLWWPVRRRFQLGNAFPRGWARRLLIHWHRDMGALLGPLLLLLLLSGAGIVFYETAGSVLHAILPEGAATGDPSAATRGWGETPVGRRADTALLAEVRDAFPDARLVFYYPPTEADPRHGFRLKRPCELHPNGRSYLYVGVNGTVPERTDACAGTPAERTRHALYPVHAGRAGSVVYQFATFVGGMGLAALAFSGALAYAGALTRGPRPLRSDDMGP